MHWFKRRTFNPLGTVNRSCEQTSLRVECLRAEQLCCLQITARSKLLSWPRSRRGKLDWGKKKKQRNQAKSWNQLQLFIMAKIIRWSFQTTRTQKSFAKASSERRASKVPSMSTSARSRTTIYIVQVSPEEIWLNLPGCLLKLGVEMVGYAFHPKVLFWLWSAGMYRLISISMRHTLVSDVINTTT